MASQWTEPYLRHGLLATNLACPPKSVVAFSNQCGTVEQWIREGENAADDQVKQRVASCRFMEPIRTATLPLHVNWLSVGEMRASWVDACAFSL